MHNKLTIVMISFALCLIFARVANAGFLILGTNVRLSDHIAISKGKMQYSYKERTNKQGVRFASSAASMEQSDVDGHDVSNNRTSISELDLSSDEAILVLKELFHADNVERVDEYQSIGKLDAYDLVINSKNYHQLSVYIMSDYSVYILSFENICFVGGGCITKGVFDSKCENGETILVGSTIDGGQVTFNGGHKKPIMSSYDSSNGDNLHFERLANDFKHNGYNYSRSSSKEEQTE